MSVAGSKLQTCWSYQKSTPNKIYINKNVLGPHLLHLFCSRAKWVSSWGISRSRLEIDKKEKRARPQSGRQGVHLEYWLARREHQVRIIRYILNSAVGIHTRRDLPSHFLFSRAAAENRKISFRTALWLPDSLSQGEQSRRKNIFTQRQIIMLRVSFYGRTILREQKCNPRPHTYLYTSAGRLYAPDFTFKTPPLSLSLGMAGARHGPGGGRMFANCV